MMMMPPARLASSHVALEGLTLVGGLVRGEQMRATCLVVESVVLVEDKRLGHIEAIRCGGHTHAGHALACRSGQVAASGWRWRPTCRQLWLLWHCRAIGLVDWRCWCRLLLGQGDRVRWTISIVSQIADCILNEGTQRGRVNTEIDIVIVKIGEQKDGHTIGEHPNILVLIDLDVSGEHQADIVAINDIVELWRIRHRRVPTTNSILINQIEELNAIVTHDTRRGVCIRSALIEGNELVVGVLGA